MPKKENKLVIKLQKSQEFHHRILQRHSQMKQNIIDLIEKYQKKDIYSQKKGSKLLMS